MSTNHHGGGENPASLANVGQDDPSTAPPRTDPSRPGHRFIMTARILGVVAYLGLAVGLIQVYGSRFSTLAEAVLTFQIWLVVSAASLLAGLIAHTCSLFAIRTLYPAGSFVSWSMVVALVPLGPMWIMGVVAVAILGAQLALLFRWRRQHRQVAAAHVNAWVLLPPYAAACVWAFVMALRP